MLQQYAFDVPGPDALLADGNAPADAPAAAPRLDQFLHAQLRVVEPEVSRARIQRLIADGHAHIDGQLGRAAARLRPGQAVTLHVPAPVPMALEPVEMPLHILFEDAHMLVINKAADLPVHPGAGAKRATLVHGLLAHCTDLSGIGGVLRPGIVHRLDAGTTGVIVVAKHDAAHTALAAQFAKRETDKRYLALVLGQPKTNQGSRNTFFGRHPRHRQRFTGMLTEASRRAHSEWRLRATNGKMSLIEVRLHTGRTHQARVHMAEMGHPIVGDRLYGSPNAPVLAALTHQALHAWRLRIAHPITGAQMAFEAPPPASWWPTAAALPPVSAQDTSSEVL